MNQFNRLRDLTHHNIQQNWRFSSKDLTVEQLDYQNWPKVSLNDKEQICWPAGCQVIWLTQTITIPPHLKNYPLTGFSLRVILTWWAESAQIYVNGILTQEGDLFDSSVRLLLTTEAIPSQQFNLALRLVSPNHDQGALTQSLCVYSNPLDPGFIADELTILNKYLTNFCPEKLEEFNSLINQIDWENVAIRSRFDQSLAILREKLMFLSPELKQRCFHIIGHAHLDLAWLWTFEATQKAAEKTFLSVLDLQKNFSHLIFCHTTPALYAWIEANRPELFKLIQGAIAQGKWEYLGGMWVECDANLISGESFARQFLYGQNYFKAKFGSTTSVAWLPDTFGFSWQLPQFLCLADIKYFVTTKLHWNDTTKFPHGCFWWQAPDGSSILSLLCCPLSMDTNPLKMTDYAVSWETQTEFKDTLWLAGIGDHGGGPTRDMLEVAKLWEDSPFFPEIRYSKAVQYFQLIQKPDLPLWDDELYLEFHRGCYTTHAKQKQLNRRSEGILYQAELFATVALLLGEQGLPIELQISSLKAHLQQAWKITLFNQFHDILPGTSITEALEEASSQSLEAQNCGENILKGALEAITSLIDYSKPPHPQAQPIVVFNPLNWSRTEVVELTMENLHRSVYNSQGEKIISQVCDHQKLLFLADIPSIGYQLYWLVPEISSTKTTAPPLKEFKLENSHLRVIIESTTGELSSIYDKNHHREILQANGNQLQAFTDQGQYWDAWNIDPQYHQHPKPFSELKTIKWQQTGPLVQSIRVVRQVGNSLFTQDYVLAFNSPLLKIITTVDWVEDHVLVKAAFPLNLKSDYVTYEIACGAIKRSTEKEKPADQAKWEVPAISWADLTDSQANYGFSLLNDCKYGYDAHPSQLRLSLLRAPTWPDPTVDRGFHQFTYAVYPHPGDWQTALTVHKAYELNFPLLVHEPQKVSGNFLPPLNKFLDLGADNLILMCLKPGEEEGWILRFYEAHGKQSQLKLEGSLRLAIASQLNLLEQRTKSTVGQNIPIAPWKITTFDLKNTIISQNAS